MIAWLRWFFGVEDIPEGMSEREAAEALHPRKSTAVLGIAPKEAV